MNEYLEAFAIVAVGVVVLVLSVLGLLELLS